MGVHRILQTYDTVMHSAVIRDYYEYSDFFNYGYWRAGTKTQREASENLVDALLDFVPTKGGRILDVACGLGATTRHLLRHYDRHGVVGVNISPAQLETSRRNVPGGMFAAMDAVRLGFADRTFDAVICVEAAFHFVTREAFCHEAHRVLKPGGTLVLSDIIFRKVPRRHDRTRWVPENFVDDLDQYRDVFRRAGFSDVEVLDVTGQSWKAFRRNSLRWGFRKLRAREIPLSFYTSYTLWWAVLSLITKQYLLVRATKS